MKNLLIGMVLAILATPVFAEDGPALKDAKDKVSYGIGLDIGSTFKRNKMDLNTDVLAVGIKDGLTGAKPQMTDDEIRQVMGQVSKNMTEKKSAADKSAREKNKTEGQKIMAQNKEKP